MNHIICEQDMASRYYVTGPGDLVELEAEFNRTHDARTLATFVGWLVNNKGFEYIDAKPFLYDRTNK